MKTPPVLRSSCVFLLFHYYAIITSFTCITSITTTTTTPIIQCTHAYGHAIIPSRTKTAFSLSQSSVRATSITNCNNNGGSSISNTHLRRSLTFVVSPLSSVSSSSSSTTSSQSPPPSSSSNHKSSPNNNTDDDDDDDDNCDGCWASYAILLASFTDGIVDSATSQALMRYGLVSTLLRHTRHTLECQLRESALASPCQGPNVDVLNRLEEVDALLIDDEETVDDDGTTNVDIGLRNERTERMLRWVRRWNDDAGNVMEFRIVYIPTAMYALRSDSQSSPGKQRQRARADGKKRRNQLVSMVERLIGDGGGGGSEGGATTSVRAVTLDLSDSSVKQSFESSYSSSSSSSNFPTDGTEALTSWKPHLVYVEGGNTFWLQHCIDEGGWGDVLNDVLCCRSGGDDGGGEGKEGREGEGPKAMYMGKSAGAIVAGKWMETACWKEMDDPFVVPGREQYKDWKATPGLNLAGGASIFPHMKQEWISTVKEGRSNLPPSKLQQEGDARGGGGWELLDGIDNHDDDDRGGSIIRDGRGVDLHCLSDRDVCFVEGSTKDRWIVFAAAGSGSSSSG